MIHDFLLFRRPSGQERIDQLGQILAVTAFEDHSRRSIDLAQKFSKRSEILALERSCRLEGPDVARRPPADN